MPFIYPNSFEMSEIQQDLISRGMEDRLGMKIMPVVEKNIGKVRWRQKDNFYGLQHMRGRDGAPTRVYRVETKVYEYEPGYFGEFEVVTETELTERAASFDVAAVPIDITDIVMECDEQLVGRELDRIESSEWTLLTTGTISIKLDGPDGIQVGYTDTYSFQQYTPGTSWINLSTATPIVNMQYVQQLGQAAGHSVDFGAGAIAVGNQYTCNQMINNANAADFGGRRNQYGATLNNLPAFNSYFAAQNLPTLVPYDEGYINKPTAKGGTYQKYLPNQTIVVIGKRPKGARVGEYIKTRNASNNFKPGSYRKVYDRANGTGQNAGGVEAKIPATIEVHYGHNGGPTIYYPSAVCVMHV